MPPPPLRCLSCRTSGSRLSPTPLPSTSPFLDHSGLFLLQFVSPKVTQKVSEQERWGPRAALMLWKDRGGIRMEARCAQCKWGVGCRGVCVCVHTCMQHIPGWRWVFALPGFWKCTLGRAKTWTFLQKSQTLLFHCVTVDLKWEFLFSNSQSLKDHSFYIKMIAFARDLQSN